MGDHLDPVLGRVVGQVDDHPGLRVLLDVEVRIGDGYYGWPEAAPFDVILVTAVAGHVPPPLIEQLKPGGRMVLPVGTRFTTQQLVLVYKRTDGKITTRQLLPVRFVPLTGGHD